MPATNSDANSKSMHKKAHKWPHEFSVHHDLRQKLTVAHRIHVTMDRAARCTRLQIHTTKAIIDYATTATARILHKTAFDARAHLKASIELQHTASSIPSNKSPAFAFFCFLVLALESLLVVVRAAMARSQWKGAGHHKMAVAKINSWLLNSYGMFSTLPFS